MLSAQQHKGATQEKHNRIGEVGDQKIKHSIFNKTYVFSPMTPDTINPYFSHFKKKIANPFAFRLFLLAKLPVAFMCGLRLSHLEAGEAVVSVHYSWFNKNPFRSVYFAVLAMAAEASTGILCMSAVYKRKPSVSMLIVKIEGNFVKKAVGKISFTCSDGLKVQEAVADVISGTESGTVTCQSTGRNVSGEVVATFFCTWSFRARSTA